MPSGPSQLAPPHLWGQAAQASRRPPIGRGGGNDLAAHGRRSQVLFGAAPRSPPVPSGPSGTLHTCGSGRVEVWLALL